MLCPGYQKDHEANFLQYPLHLINLASIRDVERQMPAVKGAPRLSARRFRANIISKQALFLHQKWFHKSQKLTTSFPTVTGPPAYTEDTWKTVKIGFYEYAVSCRTARCKLPNVNQTNGQKDLGYKGAEGKGEEPDGTLRRVRQVDEGAKGYGVLGMQMCPLFSGAGNQTGGGSNWNGAGVNSKEGRIAVGDEIKVLEEGEHFYVRQWVSVCVSQFSRIV